MAVTIHQNPDTYTPSDNPVVWTFSSTQTAAANFVYLVEVYVDGVLVANELVFPESGIYGKFDASGYASAYCGLPDLTQDLYTDAANYREMYIKVIERFGSPVADGANATSSTITVFKAGLSDENFIDWDSSNYIVDTLTAVNWLVNFPGGYTSTVLNPNGLYPNVRTDEGQFRMMLINDENNMNDLEFELYDSDGVLVADATGITVTAAAYKITIFNFTPSVIVGATSLTQANFDASSYMVFRIAGSAREYRLNFDTSCVYPSYKRLHFLTEIGSIESFTFGLLSKRKGNIKTHSYRRNFGGWNGSAYEFGRASGRDQDYAKVSERMIELESDWLDESIQYWLVTNAYESPAVWLEYFADGTLQRRSIQNTSWMEKYNTNDTLFREKVTLKEPTKTSAIV